MRYSYSITRSLATIARNTTSPSGATASRNIKLPGTLPWREAASLLLVSPGSPEPEGKDKPHFLVTKRSKGHTSFASMLCFPGGNFSKPDEELTWVDMFAGATAHDISKGDFTFIKKGGEIPIIYHRHMDKDEMVSLGELWENKMVPKNVSLRITAIRETFEETGILLCKLNDVNNRGKGLGQDSEFGVGGDASVVRIEDEGELRFWQDRVRNDPGKFQELCLNFKCVPDINALVEWSDWLTPNCFGIQRYDTIFYMAIVPKQYPLVSCPKEVESADWLTADRVLKDFEEKQCKMMAPQIYELSRLRTSSLNRIRQLMKIRLKMGIQRWCPAYLRAKDGYLFLFPGDDLYPLDMKVHVTENIRSNDKTIDELRDTTTRHHRIEARSEFDFKMQIKNYQERAGHIYLD